MVAYFILIVLILMSAAVLGVQIGEESTLILRVKQWLNLMQPYSKSLLALSKFKTWVRMIGTISYVLSPLILALIIIIHTHRLIAELLDCSKCVAYHIAWILLYFLVGIPFILSLVFAPLALLGVYFIENMRK